MTLTIDLPEEVASRMQAMLPEEERREFAVSAIAEALMLREQDEAECIAAVEGRFADYEAGRTISLEEEKARWETQKAKLLTNAGGRISGQEITP